MISKDEISAAAMELVNSIFFASVAPGGPVAAGMFDHLFYMWRYGRFF